MKMDAKTFDVMARHMMGEADKLAGQFKRGEITEEEQREGIRDEMGFWACLYSPEELDEGERLWIEERKKELAAKYRKEYGTGTALKDLSKGDRERAKERLHGIPAELETIYYLHDTGKVLFDVTRELSSRINYYDGIDVAFMDQEETEQGTTNLAGIDTKNTKKHYGNFLIETQLRNERTGWEWSCEYAWGKHVLNPNNRNRYVFYVRGKNFGQARLIDEDKSERENAMKILEYYHGNPGKLNHVIEIIRAEDVRRFLAVHPQNEEAITEYCIGYLLKKTDWTAAGLPALCVTKSATGWTETQMTASNPLTVHTAKYKTQADISKSEQHMRTDQAEGLSLSLLKSLFGLPDEIWTEAEINERVRQQYDY